MCLMLIFIARIFDGLAVFLAAILAELFMMIESAAASLAADSDADAAGEDDDGRNYADAFA